MNYFNRISPIHFVLFVAVCLTACTTTESTHTSGIIGDIGRQKSTADSVVLSLAPATSRDPETVNMIPVPFPTAIRTLEVYDATQKKRVEKDVLAMTSEEIREHLKTTETFITIEKRDNSGKFVYIGNSGKVDKGVYRVTFDYLSYTNESLSANGYGAKSAIGRIGVGLRVTAELSAEANSVDLSGLLPIGIAAQQNKISGQLRFTAYGIYHPSLSMAVPASAFVDASGIQKSFEAAAAVRALFSDPNSKLTPYLIGVARVEPSIASQVIESAEVGLGKRIFIQ